LKKSGKGAFLWSKSNLIYIVYGVDAWEIEKSHRGDVWMKYFNPCGLQDDNSMN